jgi:predicted  nucleic acid-binding Zn-ribbon protein
MEKLGVTKQERLEGLLKEESLLMNKLASFRAGMEQGEKTASEQYNKLNDEIMAIRSSITELQSN